MRMGGVLAVLSYRWGGRIGGVSAVVLAVLLHDIPLMPSSLIRKLSSSSLYLRRRTSRSVIVVIYESWGRDVSERWQGVGSTTDACWWRRWWIWWEGPWRRRAQVPLHTIQSPDDLPCPKPAAVSGASSSGLFEFCLAFLVDRSSVFETHTVLNAIRIPAIPLYISVTVVTDALLSRHLSGPDYGRSWSNVSQVQINCYGWLAN